MILFLDPTVEKRADDIVHLLQEELGNPLSEKSRWDIFSNVRAAVHPWRERTKRFEEMNHALRWNELRIHLVQEKPPGYAHIIRLMGRLDNRESLRHKMIEFENTY